MDEDDGRWMSAWLDLLRTFTVLWEQVETQMRRDHGISMARYDVLIQLHLAGGRLGLSELASALLLSPSGLSKLLDRMEASGLVVREPDPADARAFFAALTPKGRRAIVKARTSHHAFLRSEFGGRLSDRDLADLARVMGKLSAPREHVR